MGFGAELGFVRLSRGANTFTECEVLEELVDCFLDTCGKTVIVTTSDLTWDELGEVLIRHGRFEGELDLFRKNLASTSEYESAYDTVRGMFLMDFLSMILKSQLNLALVGNGNMRETPDDILNAFRGVRMNLVSGSWVLDDLDAEQTRVLGELGLKVPDAAMVSALGRHAGP